MKIALWRYGLPIKLDDASTVGGGKITRNVLQTLVRLGHDVTVFGRVHGHGLLRELRQAPSSRNDISSFDVAVILTGVYNPMFSDSVFDTYRKLASFEGPVLYLQWDCALPFYFNAMRETRASTRAKVLPQDVFENKQWFILSQTKERDLRAQGEARCGYKDASFTEVPCLFELVELEHEPLPVREPIHPRLAYFGSDRLGRLSEIQRWFAHKQTPPMHLFGKWSNSNLQRLCDQIDSSVSYQGQVEESRVIELLNTYTATMYLADVEYVKTDFLAQRLFENANASIPVIYSDKLQPTVARLMDKSWVVSDVYELNQHFAQVCRYTKEARQSRVEAHRSVLKEFAKDYPHTFERAFAEVIK